MIVRELFEDARRRLDEPHEAEWIVEEAVGSDPGQLPLCFDRAVTVGQVRRVDSMVERRTAGEPIQYVLGHWPFRTLDLLVDGRVLIPRPETEVLVDLVLGEIDRFELPSVRVLDLGTGSGAIAISVAVERAVAQVVAVERSPDALAVARANLAGAGRAAARVTLVEGSWYDAVDPALKGAVHVIASNPPYVSRTTHLDESVADWEPLTALYGADGGLGDVASVLDGAVRWLLPGGAVVCEIDSDRASECRVLALRAGLDDVAVVEDLSGRPRFVTGRRPVS